MTRAPYAELSGEGARLAGARWNRPGRSAIYAAESRALAVLEALVHVRPALIPTDLVLMTIAVPEDIQFERWTAADLPNEWREIGSASTLDLGDRWLEGVSALVLQVPSAVIPEERNIIINPLHPEFSQLEIVSRTPFEFDSRLIS